jgi:pilus assembly protein CpaE
MTQLGLIGVDDEFQARLAGALGEDAVLVRCGADDLDGDLPPTIVVGPGVDTAKALEMTQRLDSTRRDVGVIIVAEPHPDLMRAALLAGARDVWSPAVNADELEASLQRVFVATERRREYTARHGRPTPEAATNTVIVVLSPKGGAGKTMVSTNLGVGIAETTGTSVVLVDLDMQFGDVATALALHPEETIADAVSVADNLTALKTMLTGHPSGLQVLCAPLAPEQADRVTPADAGKMVRTLQRHFATTIIDTAAGLDDYTLGALEMATDLVLVSTTDIFAINGTRKLLEVLEAIDIGEPDRHLVLNRANARVNIARSEIEATLNWRVDVEIPSTRAVPLAMNKGESLLSAGRVARRPMLELLGRFIDDGDGPAS